MEVKLLSEKQKEAIIATDKIKFDRSIYPRFDPSEEDIERYAELLKSGEVKPEDFPPIVIDQYYRLLDGYHRWQAHILAGLEMIRAKVKQVSDDYEALQMACRLNAAQGMQLKKIERKENAVKLYKMACKGFNLPSVEEMKAIAKAVGVSYRTLYLWTEEIRAGLKKERNEKIKQLRKEGKTQQEISEMLGVSQQTVSYVEDTFTKNCKIAKIGKDNSDTSQPNSTDPYWTEEHQESVEYLHKPMPSEREEEPEYRILSEDEYERYKREEEKRKRKEAQKPLFDLNTRRGVCRAIEYIAEHASELAPEGDEEELAWREEYLRRKAEREKYGIARIHFEEFQRRNKRYVAKITSGIKWFEQLSKCGIGMLGVLKDHFQRTEDPDVKNQIRKMRAEVRAVVDQAIGEVEESLKKFKGMYHVVLLDEEKGKDSLLEAVEKLLKAEIIKSVQKEKNQE